jgi:hypothetical protein
VLVGAELLLAHVPANPPAPRRLAFPFTPPVGFLYEHRTEGRMAALDRAFPPNLPSLYGLSDARVYDPAAPADYVALLAPIIPSWWGELPLLGAPENPLYARLGVRYLLTAPGTALPPPWRRVFATGSGWIFRQPTIAPEFGISTAPDRELPATRLEESAMTFWTDGSPGAASLKTSLYQDGGWRLLVDRQRHPTAADPFLAAELPSGARRLDLLYRPRFFLLGCFMAALGWAGLAAVAGRPPLSRPA